MRFKKRGQYGDDNFDYVAFTVINHWHPPPDPQNMTYYSNVAQVLY